MIAKKIKVKCPKCGTVRGSLDIYKKAQCFKCGKVFIISPKSKPSRRIE